jgi:hypothetical protein
MQHEGPPLEGLLRRLLETPADFLAEPRIGSAGDVDVAAVVWDVCRDLGGEPPPARRLAAFHPSGFGAKKKRNQLRLALVGCWLLADPWFRRQATSCVDVLRFLEETTAGLDTYLPIDRLLNDPDRREEFTRRLLAELDLRPAGESIAQAADRLQTLDSAERQRVLRDAAAAERRAQQIREAMARAAAQDAASRYGE